MRETAFVYMLASARDGTIHVGVTSDLIRCIAEDRLGLAKGFTRENDVKRLVWYELHTDLMEATAREKRLKQWKRVWKIDLIQEMNPHWDDLYAQIHK